MTAGPIPQGSIDRLRGRLRHERLSRSISLGVADPGLTFVLGTPVGSGGIVRPMSSQPWTCPRCHSINQGLVPTCYSCGLDWRQAAQEAPLPSVAPQPTVSRRTGLILVVMAMVAMVAVAAIGAVALMGGGSSHALQGSVTVPGAFWTNLNSVGDACDADAGSGIAEGLNVVILDAKSVVIGSTDLGAGITTKLWDTEAQASSCAFPFAVTVPDSPFYTIRVGHRPGLTYSRDELELSKWQTGLYLGVDPVR